MPQLGMDSKVNYNGTITTIRQLAASGLVRFSKTDNWYHKTKGKVTAYFADTGPDKGYQIARFTYEAAVKQWPHLAGELAEPEPVTTSPYTFAEYQIALTQKLQTPALLPYMWLLEADSSDWRRAYRWLLTASESDIIAYAARVDSPSWDETAEPYSGA